MIWSTIVFSGLITYLLRFSMIALIKREMLTEKTKIVLSYVPSAVFPAIIFPAVFLDVNGYLLQIDNPKILAAGIAVIFGLISKNLILTIFSGLISYWIIIFAFWNRIFVYNDL